MSVNALLFILGLVMVFVFPYISQAYWGVTIDASYKSTIYMIIYGAVMAASSTPWK